MADARGLVPWRRQKTLVYQGFLFSAIKKSVISTTSRHKAVLNDVCLVVPPLDFHHDLFFGATKPLDMHPFFCHRDPQVGTPVIDLNGSYTYPYMIYPFIAPVESPEMKYRCSAMYRMMTGIMERHVIANT